MPTAVIVDAVRSPMGRGKPGGALVRRAPGRPARRDAHRAGRPHRHRPGHRRRRPGRLRRPGRRAVGHARPAGVARGRLPGARAVRRPSSASAAPASRRSSSPRMGIVAGAYDVVVAGGIESMSRVPMGSARQGADPYGPGVRARFPDLVPQGVSRRAGRRQVGPDAPRARRVRRRLARPGRAGRGVGRLRRRDRRRSRRRTARWSTATRRSGPGPRAEKLAELRAAFGTDEMRGPLPRHRLEGHRRQLLADHRRRERAAADERGASRARSGCGRAPGSSPRRSSATTRC